MSHLRGVESCLCRLEELQRSIQSSLDSKAAIADVNANFVHRKHYTEVVAALGDAIDMKCTAVVMQDLSDQVEVRHHASTHTD
jgi:hypothetical protein